MQSVDFTTLVATCAEIRGQWLPARVEQVYQSDRFTIALYLRTIKAKGWLYISWHPQGARICMGDAPPKVPDTFTFSDQLRHQINGYALTNLSFISPWERVVNLEFAKRPGEDAVWRLYVEVMGKYSNVILTDADDNIVTVAHQVNANQSTVRTVQTGQPYQIPPALMAHNPGLEESFTHWQGQVSLIPGAIEKQLVKAYRGVSPMVARSILGQSRISPETPTPTLSDGQWKELFNYWQQWLSVLKNETFEPGWTEKGYTVLGWDRVTPVHSVQKVLFTYYQTQLQQQLFQQLHHQLTQKVQNILSKLYGRATAFKEKLEETENAEQYRSQADLLMAYLHTLQNGLKSVTLEDFQTGKPVEIKLNPEKTPVQNAQFLYKQHQKLKRAVAAIEPLLKEVNTEISYLEQVAASLKQLNYESQEDLQTLEEIQEELTGQKYLESSKQTQRQNTNESHPHRYLSPSGFEIWIGRNNKQNDILTFRTANDYDLWFHSQEIPGSHVLLRIDPGQVAEEIDLQTAANWAAYYSQARSSEQVPVIYTKPKHVYKPKGAKPGMVIYKQEQVIWGYPDKVALKPDNGES
ncbi:MAG: Rqc2 RqcH [Chroococcopsis gigantea SAG 12.99]|jgi:predicted ribosome quality control (RQC) complex YloA/Tae2 family protein|nr:Rqc2 RqcH [Chroococcopsis gigantea SAG 12.99]